MSDWEDVAIGPPATTTSDGWEDVAFGPPPTVETQPLSFWDSTKFVGKSAINGVANIADLADQFFSGPKIGPYARPASGNSLRELVGSPYDLGNGQVINKTPATQIAGAAMEGAVVPGGQIGNALAAAGSEAGHQLAPDSVLAPVAGALIGGISGNAAESNLTKLMSRVFGPQTELSAQRLAANTLSRVSGNTADDVTNAIALNSSDPLAAQKTSAELLRSPELATLEQAMGTAKPTETALAAQNRSDAVNNLLSSIAKKSGALPENTGAEIQDAISSAAAASGKRLEPLYGAIPKDIKIESTPVANEILNSIDTYWGPGSPEKLPKDLASLLEPVIGGGQITAEELKNARTHLIQYLEKAKVNPGMTQEVGIASTAVNGITKTLLNDPTVGPVFERANTAASLHHELFGTGPLSKIDSQLPSKVIDNILASPESADKALAMIGNNPNAIQAVKDQIASDLSGLSDIKRINFITDNESELKKLLPARDFSILDAIRNDAKLRQATERSANPTRGSNTALKLQGVIQRALTGKDEIARPAGVWADLVKIAGYAGAGAAGFAHPAIAVPAVLATAGTKALRTRSTGLVQNALFEQLKNPEAFAAALKQAPEEAQSFIASALKGLLAKGPSSVEQPVSALLGSVLGAKGSPSEKGVSQSLPVSSDSQLAQPERKKQQKGSTIPSLEPTASKTANQDYSFMKTMFKGGASMDLIKAPVAEVEKVIDSDPFDAAVYQMESDRNPKAKNPTSSASGGFQLIKSVASKLGVKDVFDLGDNYQGFKKLKEENVARFGNNPELLYSAHYLGATLLDKVLNGEPLTATQESQVKALKNIYLPRFKRIYQEALKKTEVTEV